MFVSLRMLAFPQGLEAERDHVLAILRDAAPDLPGLRGLWLAPVLDKPVINAGQIVWRMSFDSEREAIAATLSEVWVKRIAPLLAPLAVTGVGYRVTRTAAAKEGPGIWRALVFRVVPQGFPQQAARLEDEVLLFPKYISTIKSWALSQVSLVEGPKAFTHVWEQEYDSVEGLTGEYMTHPLHWGLVDSYFDAELPQYIVDPHLIQVVGEIDGSIMKSAAPAASKES